MEEISISLREVTRCKHLQCLCLESLFVIGDKEQILTEVTLALLVPRLHEKNCGP